MSLVLATREPLSSQMDTAIRLAVAGTVCAMAARVAATSRRSRRVSSAATSARAATFSDWARAVDAPVVSASAIIRVAVARCAVASLTCDSRTSRHATIV